MKYEKLTSEIINSFYKVYNTLGYGFLEKVYENALIVELINRGFFCEKQKQVKVYYEGEEVGDYFADIVVNKKVILELKAAEGLREENELQLINYLKATKMEVGLLLNFGKKTQFVRKIYSNGQNEDARAVSYTHLTLPTIYSV